MNEFDEPARELGFPATSERVSRKSRGRRSFRLPYCPEGRPKSGRGPDGVGLPATDRSTLARVPMLDGTPYYATVCSHGCLALQFPAADDSEAIRIALEDNPDSPLSCEPALATAAKRRGIPTKALSPKQALELAMFAMLPMVAGSLTEEAFETMDVPRFLYACAGFAWSCPWRSDLAFRPYEVSISEGAQQRKLVLVLQPEGVEPGAGFGLLRPEARHRLVGGMGVVDGWGEIIVTMHRVPEHLRPLLKKVNETDYFPWATSLRDSPRAAPLTPYELRLVTGVLECFAPLTVGIPIATSTVDDLVVTMKPRLDSSAA